MTRTKFTLVEDEEIFATISTFKRKVVGVPHKN